MFVGIIEQLGKKKGQSPCVNTSLICRVYQSEYLLWSTISVINVFANRLIFCLISPSISLSNHYLPKEMFCLCNQRIRIDFNKNTPDNLLKKTAFKPSVLNRYDKCII